MQYERVEKYIGMIDRGEKITFGDALSPAMEITEPEEAEAYLRVMVCDLRRHGKTVAEAEAVARSNLGYFAGYYDAETRSRVERLFNCEHPVFGAIADRGEPSAADALWAGVRMAQGV